MNVQWRKSSHSGGVEDKVCVEVARIVEGIGVRDSTNPDGGQLNLTGRQFTGLVAQIKRNALDR